MTNYFPYFLYFRILDNWPNTYTFTKALAEKELRINAGNIPVGIIRPSICKIKITFKLKSLCDRSLNVFQCIKKVTILNRGLTNKTRGRL